MSSTTSRRPHRKTKTGCDSCKGRKIKCDEQKPICRNCEKQSLHCEYVVLTQVRQVIATTNSPTANPVNAPSTGFSDSPDRQDLQLNILQLELLHHYSTLTAHTLSNNPANKTIWRITVPQLGLCSSFVMYGILALSSLHIARFRPETRDFYVLRAKSLHQAGLRQSTSALANVTEENCTYLYIFAALTSIIALATPPTREGFLLLGDHGLAEWLVLFRGTRTIIDFSGDILRAGPLGPMFIAGHARALLRRSPLPGNSVEEEQLNELHQKIVKSVTDQKHLQAYSQALDELKQSFTIIYKPQFQGYEPSEAFIWIFTITDEYLILLQNRTSEALAIFAHFCVLLKRVESAWWMEGWSFHLLSQIYSLLDEEHRLWIRWAIEETGWVPNQQQ